MPSYTAGVLLALTFFPADGRAAAGAGALLPGRASATRRSQSGLGVTAYALGSAVAAPLAGRVVTRIGRPLLLAGL